MLLSAPIVYVLAGFAIGVVWERRKAAKGDAKMRAALAAMGKTITEELHPK